MSAEETTIANDGTINVESNPDIGSSLDGGLDIPQGAEDKPLPIPPSLAEVGMFWDQIIVSVIVIIAAIAIYFIIRYFLNKTADSLQLERGQLKGIFSITKLALIVITITVIVFQFSSLSGVAAGAISVAAGTIIGFSSRNTISNAIAGILLLSARPFKIGDRIRTSQSDELIGDVTEITILYTKMRTIRNELVAIPNQMLLQQQIINYSGLDVVACVIEVGVTYDYNRQRVEAMLLEAANSIKEVVKEPGSVVILKRLDSYAAIYELRAYTNKPNEYLRIESDIRKKVYDLSQTYGINLIVPQAQANLESKEPNKEKSFRGSLLS